MAATINKFRALALGYNFLQPRQASGITPAPRALAYDPASRVRDDGLVFGAVIHEAASGGSVATQTYYLATGDAVGNVTLPDLTNAASAQWTFVGRLQGPFYDTDAPGFDNANKSYVLYRESLT